MDNPKTGKPKSGLDDAVARIAPHLGHWPGGPTPLSLEAMEALVREAEAARSAAIHRGLAAIGSAPSALLKAFQRWRTRRREARELSQLDDRALRDMGLSRYDAAMAAKHGTRRH